MNEKQDKISQDGNAVKSPHPKSGNGDEFSHRISNMLDPEQNGNDADDADEPQPEEPQETREFSNTELKRKWGKPYQFGPSGGIKANERYFVARFAAEHRVLYELTEREFYFYNPKNGAWQRRTTEEVNELFSQDWQRIAVECREPKLLTLRDQSLLSSLTAQLRGYVGKRNVFKRDFQKTAAIHLANGMLHLDKDAKSLRDLELRPFSPEYYSRNACPIEWNSDAKCLEFTNFQKSGLDKDDISLTQRWCGSVLLGGNPAQRVTVFDGTPGAGKSTLMSVVERIVGVGNVYEPRTKHLHERFEQSRFVGKTLLTGKDVPGKFLNTEGAQVIKKLVGHDQLSVEKKGYNADIPLLGNFGVAATCNSRLRLWLDGDIGAWLRRLMIVRYSKPQPKERIERLAETLLKEEGQGILRWMIEGAILHLRELSEIGDFILTQAQQNRVIELLAESDSLRHFVTERIKRHESENLSTEKINAAYFNYCGEMSWVPFPSKEVQHLLTDLMLEIHNSGVSEHILRDEKRVRGYPKVTLAVD